MRRHSDRRNGANRLAVARIPDGHCLDDTGSPLFLSFISGKSFLSSLSGTSQRSADTRAACKLTSRTRAGQFTVERFQSIRLRVLQNTIAATRATERHIRRTSRRQVLTRGKRIQLVWANKPPILRTDDHPFGLASRELTKRSWVSHRGKARRRRGVNTA